MKMNQVKKLKLLYRQILNEASKFENISYNVYFTNKAKESFREFFSNTNYDSEQLKVFENEYNEYLNMLKRQTVIHNLYHVDKPLVSK
ncbi:protein ISD11, putative [Plasmodium chabaudi chabaudi]|uniref:Protein ISD11, putative n=2 Tax=Plasmodium chabaudi TaxID=5825 RepID=A0A077TSF1_PLACU|nr:protein ISD11, putative [Plasmodium chabaudi chabaudi]SCM13365.1 protein ISD11, putative [Plasmodium chabaudi adami]SCM24504.1 protein ISD11, putative [Plasmodium chabaudi adami]SCM25938.1 protein ISD11, putative [Plasmodium chabaudi chabaudi]SCN62691.1 protein ISD11, putative [Plasmodium chabaudi chabaudi]VTZ70790.1 protein ISD11, putative [Plasmodium chabaudi chabaudi]|eukprot:XP_742327.1 protein ISD11, putative [Plasmodium chabaudi chabaudi]